MTLGSISVLLTVGMQKLPDKMTFTVDKRPLQDGLSSQYPPADTAAARRRNTNGWRRVLAKQESGDNQCSVEWLCGRVNSVVRLMQVATLNTHEAGELGFATKAKLRVCNLREC